MSSTKAETSAPCPPDSYRIIFDLAPYLLMLLDGQNRPVAINRAFGRVLEFDLAEVQALGWAGLLHPDHDEHRPVGSPHHPAYRRFVSKSGKIVQGLVRTSGTAQDFSDSGTQLVIIDDVTSQWAALERQKIQAQILESLPGVVLAVDAEQKILFGNQAALGCFQWSAPVMMGAPLARLIQLPPRLGLTSPDSFETNGLRWNGQSFPARVTITPLANGFGAALMVEDLSEAERKELQAHEIAHQSALGEMATGIAHEFNQCLHIIRLASEAIRYDADEGKCDPVKVQKRTTNVLTQVDHLADMVGRMRSLARQNTRQSALFDVKSAVTTAIRLFDGDNRGIGVEFLAQEQLRGLKLNGQPIRFSQMLLNLMQNSTEAILRKGLKTGGKIKIELAERGDRWALTISDNGDGVDSNLQMRMFEPFVTLKPADQSCGLGLSYARSIAGDMGGLLIFDGRNDMGGASFSLSFPLTADQRAELSQPLPQRDDQTLPADALDGDDLIDDFDPSEKRILVVDDEALSVMMLQEFLTNHGYVVDTAYDGLEAVRFAQNNVYFAVITDIRMPRLDGVELIRKLDCLQPGTPVLVVTGHLKENAASSLGGNVCGILPKPFKLTTLRDRLSALEQATL